MNEYKQIVNVVNMNSKNWKVEYPNIVAIGTDFDPVQIIFYVKNYHKNMIPGKDYPKIPFKTQIRPYVGPTYKVKESKKSKCIVS
jgi:hypothetical protein